METTLNSTHPQLIREQRFLLPRLPEGLTRASYHLQITDHFLTGTRLQLRKQRVPATNERAWKLRMKLAPEPTTADASLISLTEIDLTREEHHRLRTLEHTEVRFNRYPYEHDHIAYAIDLFMGDLLGVFVAKLTTSSDLAQISTPAFAAFEITSDSFFSVEHLASLTTTRIRAELATRKDEKSIDP